MTMAETNQGVLFCCSKTFLSWRSKPENQTIVRSASDCLQCTTYNVLPNYIWLLSTWWERCDGEEASAGLHIEQNLPWFVGNFIIILFKYLGGGKKTLTNKQKGWKCVNTNLLGDLNKLTKCEINKKKKWLRALPLVFWFTKTKQTIHTRLHP